jgi:hypothetical protein
MPNSGLKMGGTFFVEAYDKQGRLKWKDTAKNKVVNVGIQKILDITFADDTDIISTWYTAIMATTAITSTYTSTDISEATEFAEAARPVFVDARANQTVTNSANKSTFTCDKDATTMEGCFLISSNTFGSTAGLLLSGAVFGTGSKDLDSGEKLIVTYTFVASDDTSS